MGVPITEADLEEMLLHGFQNSAFRLEAQPSYAVGIERDALQEFTEGNARPPSEFDWWQEWLDLIAEHTSQGRSVERVRVLAEPPTVYQKWLLWSDRWHAAVGERISYIRRSRAASVDLPTDADWWLFDNEMAAVMRFATGGELAGIELLTDPDAVRPYRRWRELALRHAAAGDTAAA